MDILHDIFAHRRVFLEKLPDLGFTRGDNGEFVRASVLPGTDLVLTVTISAAGVVEAMVTDPAFGEPYTLHLTEDAAGSFVGRVREEYERSLREIAEQATVMDVFKTGQALALLDYARQEFGESPEYLWAKWPQYAVLRRADTDKWYAVVMRIAGSKIGLASPKTVEIIDVRAGDEAVEGLWDSKTFYPAWHMNKKTWYTILFDSGLAFEELCARLSRSRGLATR